jgi:hypothetical protein
VRQHRIRHIGATQKFLNGWSNGHIGLRSHQAQTAPPIVSGPTLMSLTTPEHDCVNFSGIGKKSRARRNVPAQNAARRTGLHLAMSRAGRNR